MGTCCAQCWSDTVKSPEDRSWTKDLTGQPTWAHAARSAGATQSSPQRTGPGPRISQ